MSSEQQTRRNFLKGPVGLRERSTLENGIGGEAPPSTAVSTADKRPNLPPIAADTSAFVVSVRRRAMACEFEVQLAAARDDDSMEHVFAGLDLVEALESQLTVYRDDSEIADINRRAAVEPVPVEPRLFALLQEAARLHAETGGALDITSGPLSEAWGFSRREGRVPSDVEVAAARKLVGVQYVVLDETQQTIAFRRPGMAINLNSLGKGYALDRMAELLHEHFVDDYLLHGGKSSVLARGDQPGGLMSGWTIGVRHPLRPGERLAEIRLAQRVTFHIGFRHAILHSPRPTLWSYLGPAHWSTSRGIVFRHCDRPHRGGGRRPVDRILCHGAAGGGALLRNAPAYRSAFGWTGKA